MSSRWRLSASAVRRRFPPRSGAIMLSILRATRVFLATVPTDMRKGFDGLHALVEMVIEEDPFAGHLFVFRNKRREWILIQLLPNNALPPWFQEGNAR